MDASTRAYHVYGKTASGTEAINASRRTMSTGARRVLILVDGQRSVGELSDMLGQELVETALAELETLGHVTFLRRFTESAEDTPGMKDDAPAAPPEVSLPAPQADRSAAASQTKPPTISVSYPPARAVVAGSVPAVAPGPSAASGANAAPPSRPAPATDAPPAARSAAAPGNPPHPRPAEPPPSAASPVATATSPAAPRPTPKPVVWRGHGAVPVWVRACVAVGACIAMAVWLSARQFAVDDTVLPAAPAPAGPLPRTFAPEASAPAAAASPSVVPATAAGPSPNAMAAPSDPTSAGAAPAPAEHGLRIRTQIAPEIPTTVRDRGITSGHVAVVLHVDTLGRVERVELLSADPPDVYDKNMEQAFGAWLFEPPGIPGRMTVDIDIRPPQVAP